MLRRCRDISTRISELENEISNIITPEKFSNYNNKSSPSNFTNSSKLCSRPKSASQNMSSTLYNNHESNEELTSDESTLCDDSTHVYPNSNNCRPKTAAPNAYSRTFNSMKDIDTIPNRVNVILKKSYATESHSKCALSPDYSKNLNLVLTAEKECDDSMIEEKQEQESNNIFRNPLSMKGKNEENINNISGNSAIDDVSFQKIDTLASEDKQMNDIILIDALREEIEKIKHKLHEIGKNAQYLKEDLQHQESKETTSAEENPTGDSNNNSLLKQLKNLQKKNHFFAKQLELHKKLQESSMKKAKDATNLLNAYESKVNALHEQALKSSKIMADSKEKFCNILRSRNFQIKSLYEVNQELTQSSKMNAEQMKQLKNNYKLLKNHYRQIEEKEIKRKEENVKLRESIKTLEKEIKSIYDDCSHLKKENIQLSEELNTTKKEVENQYNKKFITHQGNVEEIIQKSREKETKLLKEIDGMSQALYYQTNKLENTKFGVKHDTSDLQIKYAELLTEYQLLMKKYQEYEKFDEIKCKCIEQELREFSLKMKEKESIIMKERDELRALVEELATTLKFNKNALRELKLTDQRKETIIYNLNSALKQKDDQILIYKKELREVHKKCERLEKELEHLKQVLQEIENIEKPERDGNLKLLESLRKNVDQERDDNLVKQKIIDNQEKTINVLKKQIDEKSNEIERTVDRLCRANDETNRLSKHLKLMEGELKKEKEEKRNLRNEMMDVNNRKDSMCKKVLELEDTIKKYCTGDETNQGKIYAEDELEQQKKEWEILRMDLQRDKEKALHAAKFASQKLLDTVNDFQKQMSQQKCVQKKLTTLLQEKEEQLESLTTKVKALLPVDDKPLPPSEKDSCDMRNICASFCQVKQIYPEPGSKSYHLEESNSCSGFSSDM